MKDLFIAILVSFCSLVSIHAKESLQINKFDRNTGEWTLTCHREPHVFMYKETLTDGAIALGAVRNILSEDVTYYISVTLFVNRNVLKGDKLVLKLNDNNVIVLSAATDSYTIKKTVGFAVINETTAIYSISEKDLQKIINGKISKIRMECNSSSFDGKVYKNKFSKTILKDYNIIDYYLKNEKPEDQLLKDF